MSSAVEDFAKKQLENKDDIYIMSIEYYPDLTTFVEIRANTYSFLNEQVETDDENYTYYKYCEEEWDIYNELPELSKDLQAEYTSMDKQYSDDEFDDLQEEHATKIIDVCKSALKRFRETSTFKEFPKLYLNVYVREYFSNEEIIEIFRELNGDENIEDYSSWLFFLQGCDVAIVFYKFDNIFSNNRIIAKHH